MTVQPVQLIYQTVPIQDTDLHNLRNPQDYLGGTSWKTVNFGGTIAAPIILDAQEQLVEACKDIPITLNQAGTKHKTTTTALHCYRPVYTEQ